jgi:hypothetical protein
LRRERGLPPLWPPSPINRPEPTQKLEPLPLPRSILPEPLPGSERLRPGKSRRIGDIGVERSEISERTCEE